MQTVVLIMRRRPIAQDLARQLRSDENLRLVHEPDYTRADESVYSHNAGIAVIEAWESGEYGASRCLELCALLRERASGCKLLLICPEQDKTGVIQAVEAKRCGSIDDFVFYSSTNDYLASKLLSM